MDFMDEPDWSMQRPPSPLCHTPIELYWRFLHHAITPNPLLRHCSSSTAQSFPLLRWNKAYKGLRILTEALIRAQPPHMGTRTITNTANHWLTLEFTFVRLLYSENHISRFLTGNYCQKTPIINYFNDINIWSHWGWRHFGGSEIGKHKRLSWLSLE